jgi:hypothetical protein
MPKIPGTSRREFLSDSGKLVMGEALLTLATTPADSGWQARRDPEETGARDRGPRRSGSSGRLTGQILSSRQIVPVLPRPAARQRYLVFPNCPCSLQGLIGADWRAEGL